MSSTPCSRRTATRRRSWTGSRRTGEAPLTARHRTVRLADQERIPLDHGWWLPIRRRLGVTAFGINAYAAEAPGDPLIERHDETAAGAGGHEELYLMLEGAATFTVDGEAVPLERGGMLVVDPGVEREAAVVEGPATVVVLGGRPGAAMPPSPFEYWYAAIPASEAGDHDRAYEIVAEGLEHHPDHGTIHYVLGCERALAGRHDEAIEHLRIAFERDPRTREWAASDEDLDALRGDPRFEAARG